MGGRRYALAIASAYGGENTDVSDLEGLRASVSLNAPSQIRGVLKVPDGSSASEVAAELRSDHFSTFMVNLTSELISDVDAVPRMLEFRGIIVEPVAFVTTTSTQTTSTRTTSSRVTMIDETTTETSLARTEAPSFLESPTTVPTTSISVEDVLSGAFGNRGLRGEVFVHAMLFGL